MNTKIFILYHKQYPIFKSDIFEPIQTGCANNDLDLNILKDNSGDNISSKNKNFGELSAWYWVWKNYMPLHPEIKYIGFCHYRRCWDFFRTPLQGNPFSAIDIDDFSNIFNSYNCTEIEKFINGYDVILPQYLNFKNSNVYEQYAAEHNIEDLEKLIKIYERKNPEDKELLYDFLKGENMYSCLNFIIKREYFDALCTWMFDLLFELEKDSDWISYTSYSEIRTPAYLAERFINIFLMKHRFNIKNINTFLIFQREELVRMKFNLWDVVKLYRIRYSKNRILSKRYIFEFFDKKIILSDKVISKQ